ncbi:corrinoid ABC transporter substrate-binding protein [Corynebacterium atrinae]|uniref:ABC transporter substrate-binding protein n=1 Tax=Corynebacterium atrinae TaxID=1336740 RepID=UPI0025B61A20|nr:ABC transporter substrate-binding protein [Corynebacterium atrinae]WJY62347.1 corrinoid ABC transporter substrate-binding protein [Corynebacterium atrinae]
MKTPSRALLASSLCALLTLSACSSTAEESDTTAADAISVENCGATVTFDSVPERVTLINNPSVPTLAELGVLDRVTAKAGLYPEEYYAPEVVAQLDQIDTLTDQVDATGHLQISRETVVATSPDLVIGRSDTVNRQTLEGSNIRLLDEPAFCGSLEGELTYDDAYDQVRLYGKVFGKSEEAEDYIKELAQRVEKITAGIPAGEERTVAVLYPAVGSAITYAYGMSSMSHPLVTAAGLKNVFADESERVFEVTTEELINRNPDIIITLYSTGEPGPVVDAVAQLPGANSLTAVQNQMIYPMLLGFAEPPSPLAVDGLEKVAAFLEQTR